MPRIVKLLCILGTNGTGKTFLANEFVQNEINNGGKVLIVTMHENEWLNVPELVTFNNWETGARKLILIPGEEDATIKRISEKFFNGLLVFDDCGAYLGSKPPKFFNVLMVKRKQLMCDILFSAHSFRNLPLSIFSYNPTLLLKNTTSGIDHERERILKDNDVLDKVVKAMKRIKKEIKKNPYYYEIIPL